MRKLRFLINQQQSSFCAMGLLWLLMAVPNRPAIHHDAPACTVTYVPVQGFSATKGVSERYILLDWDAYPGASAYLILRKSPEGDWQVLPELVSGTRFSDSDARLGTLYDYYVYAVLGEVSGLAPDLRDLRPSDPLDRGYKTPPEHQRLQQAELDREEQAPGSQKAADFGRE